MADADGPFKQYPPGVSRPRVRSIAARGEQRLMLYLVFVDPNWVDMVVEIRRDVLTATGVPAEEIRQRLAAVRSDFTPGRMWTMDVEIVNYHKG